MVVGHRRQCRDPDRRAPAYQQRHRRWSLCRRHGWHARRRCCTARFSSAAARALGCIDIQNLAAVRGLPRQRKGLRPQPPEALKQPPEVLRGAERRYGLERLSTNPGHWRGSDFGVRQDAKSKASPWPLGAIAKLRTSPQRRYCHSLTPKHRLVPRRNALKSTSFRLRRSRSAMLLSLIHI